MNIRLKDLSNQRVSSSNDVYEIMLKILLRENKVDRDREHFWTISLDTGNKILNIELVSMGSINRNVVEPMEVFSIPLQKRAVSIIFIHNHPSSQLWPSEADKILTDKLIQCGLILNVRVKDHLIICPDGYYGFGESGLLTELEKSTRFVPDYLLKERLQKQAAEAGKEDGKKEKAREMAKAMLEAGEPIDKIIAFTGLTKAEIQQL